MDANVIHARRMFLVTGLVIAFLVTTIASECEYSNGATIGGVLGQAAIFFLILVIGNKMKFWEREFVPNPFPTYMYSSLAMLLSSFVFGLLGTIIERNFFSS